MNPCLTARRKKMDSAKLLGVIAALVIAVMGYSIIYQYQQPRPILLKEIRLIGVRPTLDGGLDILLQPREGEPLCNAHVSVEGYFEEIDCGLQEPSESVE